jgi:arsenite methyltransferase
VMSNCGINLSPDKRAVFAEAFRVLKPGGRLAISDVVATTSLPPELAADLAARSACVAGAMAADAIAALLHDTGFEDVRVDVIDESRHFIRDWMPGAGIERFIASASIRAVRPIAATRCCAPACCTVEKV